MTWLYAFGYFTIGAIFESLFPCDDPPGLMLVAWPLAIGMLLIGIAICLFLLPGNWIAEQIKKRCT